MMRHSALTAALNYSFYVTAVAQSTRRIAGTAVPTALPFPFRQGRTELHPLQPSLLRPGCYVRTATRPTNQVLSTASAVASILRSPGRARCLHSRMAQLLTLPTAPYFECAWPQRLVDSIILVFILLALQAAFVDGAFSNGVDEGASNVVTTVDFVINIAYFGTLVAISPVTLGNRLFGLYIVRPDGSRVGFGRAVSRYFASLISAAILLIGFIMFSLRRYKRGLHALICYTVVLRR